MTRRSIALLCIVLLGQANFYGVLSKSVAEGRVAKRAQETHQDDIDLEELTPDLEHQLEQAKRLSQHEPKHDRMSEEEEGDDYETSAPAHEGADWFARVHTKHKSRAVGHDDDDDDYRNLDGRAHSRSGGSAPRIMLNDDKDDRDYDLLSHPANSLIGNHEGASRGSLWTPERLQEQWNRRAIEQKQMYDRILEARRKAHELEMHKRRCETTLFIGLKDPTYCDTNDYLGATSYGKGEIWEAAGR